MAQTIENIKKDRLRYTKNKLSANLIYLGILFNVLYFVNIYQSDVNNYYYTIEIGMSILYNLVFLLFAFLASEGLKNYKKNYGYLMVGMGIMQFVRFMGIPAKAHAALVIVDGVEQLVMNDNQYTYVTVMLTISAIACMAAGIIGIVKTNTLEKYVKENGLTMS